MMLIKNRKHVTSGYIAFIPIFFLFMGCAGIPCSPPEYYAPELGAPYAAETATVSTQAGHDLVGTLTIPKGNKEPLPGVVLITGSSPQNRDHSPAELPAYRFFRQIADALSRQGIVVLRMDDRGCGCSGGGPFKSATTPERADDIRAGITFLKTRKEVSKTRIGLIGLSEGAIIAPMIAATDSSIRAVILMAGPASKFDTILDYQEGTGWRGETGSSIAWQQFLLQYDPLPTAEMISCPVLILHGDQDEHVPVEHAKMLAKAIRKGGNKDVTVKIFQGYNHGFINVEEANRKDKSGESLSEILKISPHVINVISSWVVARLNM